MTKEEILDAIRQCTRKLGHIPTKRELWRLARISQARVYSRFGSFGQAIRDAGLEPAGSGYELKSEALLRDWARLARKIRKLPTKDAYTAQGRYSTVPFERRWKSWRAVPEVFYRYTAETGTQTEWADVLALIDERRPKIVGRDEADQELPRVDLSNRDANGIARECGGRTMNFMDKVDSMDEVDLQHENAGATPGLESKKQAHAKRIRALGTPTPTPAHAKSMRVLGTPTLTPAHAKSMRVLGTPSRRPLFPGRAVYGNPMRLPGLAYEPVNEAGVILVFGMLAYRLGFVVERMQSFFPDCEAMWQIQPGRWQRVGIEFEYESRNFLKHEHRPEGCDLIVCWYHNWPECPKKIEVIELKSVLKNREMG